MRTASGIVIALVAAMVLVTGGLWLLQGLGLIVIDPIACVGDCEPLRGPDAAWAAAGAVTVGGACVLGLLAVRLLRPRARGRRPHTA